MREVPSGEPYPLQNRTEKIRTKERKEVESHLAGPNGEHERLSVVIAEDGAARRVNFWDLDKTVLWAHDVQMGAVAKIFPEAAAKDLKDLQGTFEAGWRLGNSFREWDRMFRIYGEGHTEYKDPGLYRRHFLDTEPMLKLIDEPGHPEGRHERAASILAQHDIEGSAILQRMNDEGKIDEKFLIPSMVHLLQAKTRLGEINTFITANPRRLANGLITYSGLYKYGFEVASDEDMVGGGKDVAIEHLIKKIEDTGLKVPRDRLVVLGDAEKGDVGSGFKLMKSGGYTFQGVLVRNTMDEIEIFKEAAKSDPDLKKMIAEMDVTVIASREVPKIGGQYKLGRLGSAAAAKKSQEKSES